MQISTQVMYCGRRRRRTVRNGAKSGTVTLNQQQRLSPACKAASSGRMSVTPFLLLTSHFSLPLVEYGRRRYEAGRVQPYQLGQVAERLKAHAWRACKRQKRFEGSNPSLSV
jgi:hypothetical protein